MGTAKKIAIAGLSGLGLLGAYIAYKIRKGTSFDPNHPPVLTIVSATYPTSIMAGNVGQAVITVKNTGGPDDIEYGFIDLATNLPHPNDVTHMLSGAVVTDTQAFMYQTPGIHSLQAYAKAKNFPNIPPVKGDVFTILVG